MGTGGPNFPTWPEAAACQRVASSSSSGYNHLLSNEHNLGLNGPKITTHTRTQSTCLMQVLPEENFLLEMAGLPMPILGVKGKTAVVGGVWGMTRRRRKMMVIILINKTIVFNKLLLLFYERFNIGEKNDVELSLPLSRSLSPWPEGLSPSWEVRVETVAEG